MIDPDALLDHAERRSSLSRGSGSLPRDLVAPRDPEYRSRR